MRRPVAAPIRTANEPASGRRVRRSASNGPSQWTVAVVAMQGTIKSRREFQRIYERGQRAIGAHVVVFGLCVDENRDAAERRPRIGIVASRKVGGAVDRNRAKRVLRAAIHPLLEHLPDGSRIVLVARRALIEDGMKTPDIGAELEELLERIGFSKGR